MGEGRRDNGLDSAAATPQFEEAENRGSCLDEARSTYRRTEISPSAVPRMAGNWIDTCNRSRNPSQVSVSLSDGKKQVWWVIVTFLPMNILPSQNKE